jgi:O-antigen/teichoic acid export membrane protein
VILAAAGVVFAADLQLSGALYRAADRVPAYFIVTSYVQGTLRMALSVAAVWAGGGVAAILTVNAAVAAGTVVLLELDRRRVRPAGLGRSLVGACRAAAAILRESLWMCGSLLLYSAMRLLDLMLLGAMATPAETGEYAAMSMVAQVIAIYPSAISQTLGPSIAVLHAAGDREGMQRELSGYLRQATLLGGFLLGGIAVFGVDLDLLFGTGFEFPLALVVLLAVGWYVSAVLAPLGYVLSMTGRHRQEVAILAAGVVLMAGLLLLLIPALGSIGAGLAVAITFAFVNAVRAARVLRVLRGNPLRPWHIVPPMAFTAVAAACRLGGEALVGRSLPALIGECALYSLLALALFLAAFARPEERVALFRRFRR